MTTSPKQLLALALTLPLALATSVPAVAQPAPSTQAATTAPSGLTPPPPPPVAAPASPTTSSSTSSTTSSTNAAPNHPNGHVTSQPGGKLMINFKDVSVDSVLDELSSVAGFIVVKETPVTGRVTMVSKQAITADDAISLLNTVLKNAGTGYAALQQGRILKIVSRDKAKHANIPVRSGADPTKIDSTDELITQVIPLKYADATQLKNDLQPLINPEADFTANQSSNALVMTDTSANIRRIVEIVAALDKGLADAADVKVFQLKYTTASAAAKLIEDLFGEQANARGGGRNAQNQQTNFPRFGGFFGGGGFGGGFPGGGGQGGRGGNQNQATGRQTISVNASSDDRTNTVVVTGPPDTLAVIEKVIKEIDANPASDETVFIYHLRNAQAQNVQDVVNYLFNSAAGSAPTRSSSSNTNRGYGGLGNNSSSGRSSSGFGSGSGGRSSSGFGSSGLGSGGSTAGGYGSRTGFGGGGNSGFGGFGGLSSSSQQAASSLAGQVSIIADVDTNSLLVRTSPKNYESVQGILIELDRPVPQVLIKVLVAEVSHDKMNDLGVELSALNLRASGLGTQVGTNFDLTNAATAGGLTAKVLETNFDMTIHALEQVGKLDVLSRPYILASDNQLASIIVGQTVPIPTNSRVTDTGQTINSVEYNDIGIILNVTPHINPDGLVILDVNPEISSLSGQSVSTGPGTSAPIFNKRSADSRVAILDGKTIVIGGLMEDKKTSTVRKVPLLGDLPGIGFLFQRNTTDKTKTELLIFLTPHVASRPEMLEGMSKDEMHGTKLTPKAVEPGAFDEHMRGMQRGATTMPATNSMQQQPPIPFHPQYPVNPDMDQQQQQQQGQPFSPGPPPLTPPPQ